MRSWVYALVLCVAANGAIAHDGEPCEHCSPDVYQIDARELSAEQQKKIVHFAHEALEGEHEHGVPKRIGEFVRRLSAKLDVPSLYWNAHRLRRLAGDGESPGQSFLKNTVFYFLLSHSTEMAGSWSAVAYLYFSGAPSEQVSAAAVAAAVISMPGVADPLCWGTQICLLIPATAKPMGRVRRFIEKYSVGPLLRGSSWLLVKGLRSSGLLLELPAVVAPDVVGLLVKHHPWMEASVVGEELQFGIKGEAGVKLTLTVAADQSWYISEAQLPIVIPRELQERIRTLFATFGRNAGHAGKSLVKAIHQQKSPEQIVHNSRSYVEDAHVHGDTWHFTFRPRTLDVSLGATTRRLCQDHF